MLYGASASARSTTYWRESYWSHSSFWTTFLNALLQIAHTKYIVLFNVVEPLFNFVLDPLILQTLAYKVSHCLSSLLSIVDPLTDCVHPRHPDGAFYFAVLLLLTVVKIIFWQCHEPFFLHSLPESLPRHPRIHHCSVRKAGLTTLAGILGVRKITLPLS